MIVTDTEFYGKHNSANGKNLVILSTIFRRSKTLERSMINLNYIQARLYKQNLRAFLFG